MRDNDTRDNIVTKSTNRVLVPLVLFVKKPSELHKPPTAALKTTYLFRCFRATFDRLDIYIYINFKSYEGEYPSLQDIVLATTAGLVETARTRNNHTFIWKFYWWYIFFFWTEICRWPFFTLLKQSPNLGNKTCKIHFRKIEGKLKGKRTPNAFGEWNGYPKMFSFSYAVEISRQYLRL